MIAFKVFVFQVLIIAAQVYQYLIIIYALASFFIRDRYAPWYVFLEELIDPPLRLIRKWTKGRTVVGNFDFAVIILWFAVLALIRLFIILSH